MDQKVSAEELERRQALPLEEKIKLTQERVRAWYEYWGGKVYVSFSGGKDSTVLLDIVRKIYPDVPGMFLDTGLEYPEIREFVKTVDNVVWVRPKMTFREVIDKYGYPVISKENAYKIMQIRNTKSDKLRNKRLYGDEKGNGKLPEKWKFMIDAPFKISGKCCDVMKKSPSKKYEKETGRKPIVGTMAEDSRLRRFSYMSTGCNSFSDNRPMSIPMGFWLEKDVWEYIHRFNVKYSKVYDMGANRTGCVYCLFGIHQEEGVNRMKRLKQTHPKLYDYCINNLGEGKVLDYIGVDY